MDQHLNTGHAHTEPNPPTAARLRDWERLMQRGRHAQLLDQAASARIFTQQALALAQTLLEERNSPPDDCIAALVVSHHNMAFLHQQNKAPLDAAAHLCQAHATLMALLCDATATAPLQQAAWRHSRETHSALLHFLSDIGELCEADKAACASATLQVTQTLKMHANLAQHCGAVAH